MYDLIIIGGGPAGYPSAIRASQYNLKTAVIEKEPTFGGTCLNWGCIPTKAYYESCQLISKIRNAHKFGLDKIQDFNFSLENIKNRKDKIVKSITKGVEFLLKKNEIDIYKGSGSFIDNNTIRIKNDDKDEIIKGKNFLIATGSIPAIPQTFQIGNPDIITSNEILSMTEIPSELIIIGAGAIGLEFASIFNILGSKVIIIEMLPKLAPTEDEEVSDHLQRIFARKKIKALTSSIVEKIQSHEKRLIASIKNSDGTIIEIKADKVLVSTGRMPNTSHLNLESLGIITKKGTIPVNDFGQTSVNNIYAAGDILNTPQLAHVGTAEGLRSVDHIMGKKTRINYDAVPSFIYTMPEISHAGLNEKELNARNIEYAKAVFPMKAIAKSQIMNESDGFVKLLYSKEDKKLLGFHMIGALSPELLFEPNLAIEKGLSISDISNTIHAHPTLGEIIMEAAHLAEGFPIHILK